MPKPVLTKITHSVVFVGDCPSCGKASQRSRSFSEYVQEGQDSMEVWAALVVRGRRWNPDFTHRKCR